MREFDALLIAVVVVDWWSPLITSVVDFVVVAVAVRHVGDRLLRIFWKRKSRHAAYGGRDVLPTSYGCW